MADFITQKRAPVRAPLLLIDDDLALGKLVAEYAAYEGYDVATVASGKLGLDLLAQRSFSLLILDVMLPDIDGFEVLGALRRFSDVPVLMLTTRGAASDRVRGLRMGADDYLPKPFEPDELIARINVILRRIHPSVHGMCFLSVGDVELDERSRRVKCCGAGVELTGAEFSLLQLLLSNVGTVLSRQDLIPRVLSRQEYAVDRSIDSLVSSLRKKLGPFQNGDERIRSIRGVGYVYVAIGAERTR